MANEITGSKVVIGSTVQSGANLGKDALKTSETMHNALVNPVSTSIVSQYTVSINADTTKIDITGFKAVFSTNDYVGGVATLPIEVDFPTTTALIVDDIATESFTYFGLSSNGNTSQQNTAFTETQKKTIAQYAVAFHPNGVVVAVSGLCTVGTNVASQLQGLLTLIGVGNVSGNNLIKGTGTFNLTKSVGETYAGGTNTSDLKNPDLKTNALIADTQFYYSYRDGSGNYTIAPLTSDVDLTKLDDGSGTLATIAGKKASIQRCYYMSFLNIVVVEYGQTEYKDFNHAETALSADIGTHIRNPRLELSAMRTYIIGATNASTLADTAVLFKDTRGTVSSGGSDGDTVRSSINRLDTTDEISASVTNVITPVTGKFQKINMDANALLVNYVTTPSLEGFDLVIIVRGDPSVSRTFTLDPAQFEGTPNIGMPSPTILANSLSYVFCYYNLEKAKYIVVGKA